MAVWTATGAGSYYDDITVQEIVDIKENNTLLERVFTVDDCDTTTGSFFHDINNGRLYIHTLTDDNPNNDVRRIFVAYNWLCFCNDQDAQLPYIVDFIPQNAVTSHFYIPYINDSSLGSLTQSVQDYYKSAVSIQFGSIGFGGADWWWVNKNNYLWHNNDLYIKLGEKGYRMISS